MDKERIKQMIESSDGEMFSLGITLLCNCKTIGLNFAGGFGYLRDKTHKFFGIDKNKRRNLMYSLQEKHLEELRKYGR